MKRYVRDADLLRLNHLRDRQGKKIPVLRKERDYIFYKIVRGDRSPYMFISPIRYSDGATVSLRYVDRDHEHDCGKGLHVMVGKPERSHDPYHTLIRVRVKENDIACVPAFGHVLHRPKIRVRKLTVLGEVPWAQKRRIA